MQAEQPFVAFGLERITQRGRNNSLRDPIYTRVLSWKYTAALGSPELLAVPLR